MKPLVIELYAGLFGWGAGFVSEGYRSIGFDLYKMGPVPEGCELVLQDVLTLHGSQFKDAAIIVGSSPCQEFSYRAMPFKRGKSLGPPELGMKLFQAQFRIQKEASEAAGHQIPMVVENVRGAQPWVGRAAWHYGSFFLWGDVPALMPITKWKEDGIKIPHNGIARRWEDRKVARLSRAPGDADATRIAKIPLELARHIASVFKP